MNDSSEKEQKKPKGAARTADMAQRAVDKMGPWRYAQFVVVAIVVGGLSSAFANTAPLPSVGIGVGVGIAYFLLERFRGVI